MAPGTVLLLNSANSPTTVSASQSHARRTSTHPAYFCPSPQAKIAAAARRQARHPEYFSRTFLGGVVARDPHLNQGFRTAAQRRSEGVLREGAGRLASSMKACCYK